MDAEFCMIEKDSYVSKLLKLLERNTETLASDTEALRTQWYPGTNVQFSFQKLLTE